MGKQVMRREFLGQSAAWGSSLILGYHLNSASAGNSNSSLERLNIASVGAIGRGNRNMERVPGENIVAIADIDQSFLDRAGQKHPQARQYRDYRVMLEKEADKIDAVLVSAPTTRTLPPRPWP